MPSFVSKTMEALYHSVRAQGFVEGTPQFEVIFRAKRVELCQETRSVQSCPECNYFDFCTLAKDHLKDLANK